VHGKCRRVAGVETERVDADAADDPLCEQPLDRIRAEAGEV
jgi:hypothetical protein